MDIVKRKPSDFIKPGDYVIFPADDRGIRMIKIVPNVDSEFILAYWLRMGAGPFTGEVPKSGYIFEKRVEHWAPEEIDDKIWDPRPMSNVPKKVKTFCDAMRDGDYEIGLYLITCARCEFKRETHARLVGKKGEEYRTQFCAPCGQHTLHRIKKLKYEEVVLPPTVTPGIKHIERHKNLHVYDWRKITWLTKRRSRISLFSQLVSRVLEKIRGLASRAFRL